MTCDSYRMASWKEERINPWPCDLAIVKPEMNKKKNMCYLESQKSKTQGIYEMPAVTVLFEDGKTRNSPFQVNQKYFLFNRILDLAFHR